MKLRPLVALALPAVTLAATTLLLPRASPAFVLAGGSLGEDQRDFRIFNNFADPTANDNATEHPSFPGYTGAVLAIWKGCIEWGSVLHGDGTGDPTQSDGLGNGGSNFDSTFQGLAAEVGRENDNTHSVLRGMSGNLLAFMESGFGGVSDGWRIRYYEHWLWQDGPDSPLAGVDLQGIACHEYGHALGLGHSFDGLATMAGGITGTGVTSRSIEADDMAGVQAIYGTPASEKPRIESLEFCGGQLVIHGFGFTSTDNEVWFTKSGTAGFGEPIRATGIASQAAGKRIVVTPPVESGPGDVLVKRFAVTGVSLSNAYPFDPRVADCSFAFESYCFGDGGGCQACPCSNESSTGSGAGCSNSSGTGARLTFGGAPTLDPDELTMSLVGATPTSFAILASADNALPANGACPPGSGIVSGNQDGLRCVGGNLLRHGARATDSQGNSTTPWSQFASSSGFLAGEARQFQVFYRDAAALGCLTGQNTSQALAVTFLP